MPEEVLEERSSVNHSPLECLLGSVVLPVPPAAMRIRQVLKIDEIEIKGRSGKVKQPIGYEDAEITIELELCDREEGEVVVETASERLQKLQKLFRSSQEALPQPLDIVSPLTEACGIRQALFKEFEVHDNELDYLTCTLQLTEFTSVENQLKAQAAEVSARAEAAAKSEEVLAGNAKLNEALGSPDEDYLLREYDRGKDKAMGR